MKNGAEGYTKTGLETSLTDATKVKCEGRRCTVVGFGALLTWGGGGSVQKKKTRKRFASMAHGQLGERFGGKER